MQPVELILDQDPIRVGEPVRGDVRGDAELLATGYVKLRVRDLSDGTTREWVESKSAVDDSGRFELPSPTMPSYIGARLLVE